MAWADPSTQIAGHLITADEYNEIINDLKHLRGQDGTTVLEGDVDPEVDLSKALGGAAKRWNEGHFNGLYASNGKYSLHQYIREVREHWNNTVETDIQANFAKSGGGDHDAGGSGQFVLKVDDDAVGTADIYQKAAINSAKATTFNTARSPYFRFEFSVDHFDPATRICIGLEDTPAAATVWTANDNFAGIYWSGALWAAQNSDGGGAFAQTTITAYLVADQRHVVEILVINGGNVLMFIDGTLRHTGSTLQPTGTLYWTVHYQSASGGGAGDDSFLTLGEFVLQEDLS